MAKKIDSKKIKILTSGPITAIGYIWGPVLTPYFETMNNIFKMLSAGVNIVEVADDGVEIPLSIQNYQDNNSKEARKVREDAKANADKAAEEAKKKEAEEKKREQERKEAEKAAAEAEKARKAELEKNVQVESAVDVVDTNNNRDNNYNKNKNQK